ncbi:MAG: hypothetical protein AAB446_00805 [Patescibacteria group bacterium]
MSQEKLYPPMNSVQAVESFMTKFWGAIIFLVGIALIVYGAVHKIEGKGSLFVEIACTFFFILSGIFVVTLGLVIFEKPKKPNCQ